MLRVRQTHAKPLSIPSCNPNLAKKLRATNSRRSLVAPRLPAEPAFLADVDPGQKDALLKLLAQAARHYGSINDEAMTDCEKKYGLTRAQVIETVAWANGEGGRAPSLHVRSLGGDTRGGGPHNGMHAITQWASSAASTAREPLRICVLELKPPYCTL